MIDGETKNTGEGTTTDVKHFSLWHILLAMYFKPVMVAATTAMIITIVLAVAVWFYHNTSSAKFDKIQFGMNLTEVEAIVGPGKMISGSDLPEIGGGQGFIVRGDQFWTYRGSHDGSFVDSVLHFGHGPRIYIGLRNGQVCDKAIHTFK
jgi:hypothetical protein